MGAPRTEKRNRFIRLHNGSELEKMKLDEMWSQATCDQAYEILSKDDMYVSEKADKDVLLPIIKDLDTRVKNLFMTLNNTCRPWRE